MQVGFSELIMIGYGKSGRLIRLSPSYKIRFVPQKWLDTLQEIMCHPEDI